MGLALIRKQGDFILLQEIAASVLEKTNNTPFLTQFQRKKTNPQNDLGITTWNPSPTTTNGLKTTPKQAPPHRLTWYQASPHLLILQRTPARQVKLTYQRSPTTQGSHWDFQIVKTNVCVYIIRPQEATSLLPPPAMKRVQTSYLIVVPIITLFIRLISPSPMCSQPSCSLQKMDHHQ